jgi:hypothetical protein
MASWAVPSWVTGEQLQRFTQALDGVAASNYPNKALDGTITISDTTNSEVWPTRPPPMRVCVPLEWLARTGNGMRRTRYAVTLRQIPSTEAKCGGYKGLRQVQEYMGHVSITTTEIYAHFVPRTDAARNGSAGLDSMLAPEGLARNGEIVEA